MDLELVISIMMSDNIKKKTHSLSGSALWVVNLDEQAKVRPVYAIDLPGFGKSSRLEFSDDPILVEKKFVEIVEKWRNQMKIPNFIICGHSMGGFVAFSYALSYPERLQHLILADPWGLTEKPSDGKSNKYSLIGDKTGCFFSKFVNPLAILRLAGPFGQWIISCCFPEMLINLESSNQFNVDRFIATQYLKQINLQTPTGEAAFKIMMDGFYWSKNPMIVRLNKLNSKVPMTLIFGEKSWIDKIDEHLLKKSRSNSYVMYHIMRNVGHELFAFNSNEFNCTVKKACAL